MGRKTKVVALTLDDEALKAIELIMSLYKVNRSAAVKIAVTSFARMLQTQHWLLPPPPSPPQQFRQ
ncbi:MAG: hypothetical protein QXT27_02080 [Pyrobaculum sp.]